MSEETLNPPATDTPDDAAKAQADKEAAEAKAKPAAEPAPATPPEEPKASQAILSPVAMEKLAEIAFHAHNATYREGDTIDAERVQSLLGDTEIAAWLTRFRNEPYSWRWKNVGPR